MKHHGGWGKDMRGACGRAPGVRVAGGSSTSAGPGTGPVRTTTQEPVDDAAAWSRAAVAALPDDVRPTVRVHRAATERCPGQPHLPGRARTIAGVGRKRRGRAVGAPAVPGIPRVF